jgi:transcriptional regulator with XRE-family HTH domain
VAPVGPYSRRLARLIREQRRLRKWTQEHLAELASLEPGYVGRIERAEAAPSVEIAGRIAHAFGLTFGELFPDDAFRIAARSAHRRR